MFAREAAPTWGGSIAIRLEQSRQTFERELRQLGDIQAGEFDGKRFPPKALASTGGTLAAHQILRHTFFHRGAFSRGKRLQDIASRARERALIAGFLFALTSLSNLLQIKAGVYRHRRLLFCEKQPVAILAGELTPWDVDVEAERRDDVAQILPMPGWRPCRDRPLSNCQTSIGHHRGFGGVVHST